MPIDVTSLEMQDQFGNAVTDFSLLNLGDKVTIEYQVTVSEWAISDINNPFTINYTPSMIGSNWLHDVRAQFGNFQIGDSLERKEYATNTLLDTAFSIVDKLDNSNVQLSASLGQPLDTIANSSIFNVKTPITAMKYYWNFIENSEAENYASKVDGSIQYALAETITATLQTSGVLVVGKKYIITDYNVGDDFTNVGGTNVTGNEFTASGTTPTTWTNASSLSEVVTMEFQGNKSYQVGSINIYGNGIDTNVIYGQKFVIRHITRVTPYMLSDQYTDLVQGINAAYFKNTNCLKHIFKFEAMYNFSDPNRILTYKNIDDINLNLQGNTGGFNENFNTGITNYSIYSIAFQNNLAVAIPAIELSTDETTFTITVKNTTDTPFSNNNTKFAVNFCRAPFDGSEYVNNGYTLNENFTFDSAFNTVGSAAVNGETFGGIWQVLKDVSASFVSSSEITITGKIAFASNVVSIISQSAEFRYLFWVSVQDHTKTTLNSDRVNLLASIETFYVDSSDPNMIVTSNLFLEHYQNDFDSEGQTSIVPAFLEDEIVGLSRFYIDTNGRESDIIQLTSVRCRIKAKNDSTLDDFTLDEYSINMASLPLINGWQYVNLTIPRVFHVPSTEIRKNIKLQRRSDLDSAGRIYYDVVFPFMIRWEYWVQLLTANGAFFDISEPNNGLNQLWYRYANELIADWNVYFEVQINAKKNGEPLSFVTENVMEIGTYGGAVGDYIKSYDSLNVELTNLTIPRKYILGYEDTKIAAKFTDLPNGFDITKCIVVLGIEAFEEGGVVGRRRFSSSNVQTTDTYWKTVNVIGLADLDATSSTELTATAKLDYTLLPTGKPKWSISARLYYPANEEEGIITEYGDIFLTTEYGDIVLITEY